VTTFTVVDALRRARPSADAETLRGLARGTSFFQRQGLVGDHFLTLIASLDVHGPAERDALLAAVDRALGSAHVGRVRKVGAPYVDSWLEQQSASATERSFAIFAVLLVGVTLFLYRSARALLAILLALGAAVTLGVAAGALLGFAFTVVSALVPLTIMVTTLATLTYLHSRFVDQPENVPLETHHIAALRNKLLPVTASTVAAATGFAALAVSRIEPIRQMGVWTAVGLVLAWFVAVTLFPALQLVLRTPTTRRVAIRTTAYDRVSGALPAFTYRYRKTIVAAAVAMCLAGVLAITGMPGVFSHMPIEVDVLSNIDPTSALARDMRWFRANVMDLDVAHVWIHLPRADASDPGVLHAIDGLETALDSVPGVTGVAGPTTPLRMRSYLAGHGDALPSVPEQFASAVEDFEQLLLVEPDLRAFVEPGSLSDLQLTVLFRGGVVGAYAELEHHLEPAWAIARSASSALAGARVRIVGESLLQAKVAASLVPTLAASFVLTVVCILVVFLLIFRSGLERLLAMIPSVFALVLAFLGLRVVGGSLNIATIIIATTVLGTTENDQLHFFHHMHERTGSPLHERLRHAFRVSGRAVVFATVIDAVGFLGLSSSGFPPLRQFGLLTAAAFVLALVADFTVLPAALWLASGEQPENTHDTALDPLHHDGTACVP
jgi:predicted RND superfamily exporter protein